MITAHLIDQIQIKKSFLCIGLDVDLTKIPKHLLSSEDPIFEFNKALANDDEEINFGGVLKSYEKVRWGPTTSISAKASILGYLEASAGYIAKFRDMFFFTLGSLGVAKKVYLGAAVPNVEDVPN